MELEFETEMSSVVAVKRSRRTSRTQSAVVPLATAASAVTGKPSRRDRVPLRSLN